MATNATIAAIRDAFAATEVPPQRISQHAIDGARTSADAAMRQLVVLESVPELTEEHREALGIASAHLRAAAARLEQLEAGVQYHLKNGWSAWHQKPDGHQEALF